MACPTAMRCEMQQLGILPWVGWLCLWQALAALLAGAMGHYMHRLADAWRRLGEDPARVAFLHLVGEALTWATVWALGSAFLSGLMAGRVLQGSLGFEVWHHGSGVLGVPVLVSACRLVIALLRLRRAGGMGGAG